MNRIGLSYVESARLDGDFHDMRQCPNRVVEDRGTSLRAQTRRPVQTGSLGDFPDAQIFDPRPAPHELAEAFLAVLFGPCLERTIAGKALPIDFERSRSRHFSSTNRRSAFGSRRSVFSKLERRSNAQHVRLEQPPNQLAANPNSRKLRA